MAIAVAIAVFGAHKIRELQQKAHEAQHIGQYRLKQVLGFGGMGAVYLAEHVLLRRPCAIKLIRPDQAGDPKTLIRFEREVQATATLMPPERAVHLLRQVCQTLLEALERDSRTIAATRSQASRRAAPSAERGG